MPANVSIRNAAERTGLSAHVIRAWEKRYRLLDPARSEGGHRMYSEADIQRLSLIARVVRTGRSIGSVAHLAEADLWPLLARTRLYEKSSEGTPTPADAARTFREALMKALIELDTRGLDHVFERAQVALGWQALLQLVIAPTAADIGERWREGALTAAHEHVFITTVKVFLGNITRQYPTTRFSPKIVVGTPAGQIHELGAILAAAAAANIGWQVTYLGPSLQAEEIVGATLLLQAKALCLSIVYPPDDPDLPEQLTQIRRLLPENVHLLVGGRAAEAYEPTLTAIGARIGHTLDGLCADLDAIRRGSIRAMAQPTP